MRRLLSIALLLVLGLPLFASVAAASQPTRLPACCRRAGAHHCMDADGMSATQTTVRMVCPAFPHAASTQISSAWSFNTPGHAKAERLLRAVAIGQVEAGYRVSLGRASQKRGPPVTQS